jgi:dihydroorotase
MPNLRPPVTTAAQAVKAAAKDAVVPPCRFEALMTLYLTDNLLR